MPLAHAHRTFGLRSLLLAGVAAALTLHSTVAAQPSAGGDQKTSVTEPKPTAPPKLSGRADYIIGPRDVLQITVFNQEKLTGKFVVQSDGTFAYPYLDRVTAGGRTEQAVEEDIRDRLGKEILRNPQVSVSVEQYRSQQVQVLGQVRSPGTLEYTGSITIIEALARVGDTTERAGPEALILRNPSGQPLTTAAIEQVQRSTDPNAVLRVNIKALLDGDLSQNLPLRAGDTVIVPVVETIKVAGHVSRVGEYSFRPGMTVRDAIITAGGVTDRGDDGRIRITRKVEGKEVKLNVKLPDAVQAGDTIEVLQGFF
jgi:polysaccharide export outer membrane protein